MMVLSAFLTVWGLNNACSAQQREQLALEQSQKKVQL